MCACWQGFESESVGYETHVLQSVAFVSFASVDTKLSSRTTNSSTANRNTVCLCSHTILVVFGAFRATPASTSLIADTAFGLLQPRALSYHSSEEIEVGKARISGVVLVP
jgi:hypothetical protein